MTVRKGALAYPTLVFLVLLIAVGLRYIDPFFLRALRLVAFDTLQRLDPAEFDPRLPVRIVDIDEDSLAKVGQWPWPRTVLRDLVLKLAEKKPAAVAFDILFIEPDRSSRVASQGRESPTDNDAAFATALSASPTVLAAALLDKPSSNVRTKAGFAIAGDDPSAFVVTFAGASGNVSVLDDAAHGIGAITWVPDRDQVVRRVPLVYRVQDQFFPSLAAETLRVAQGAKSYVLKSSNASGQTGFGRSTGLNHIRVGQVDVATDAGGSVYPKFRHITKEIYLPAWKALAGELPDDSISGKILLIGTSAAGLLDLRATPLDPAVPGVEIHAQLIEQMLRGEFLSRPDYSLALEVFLVLALGLMLAIILPRVSARAAISIGAVTIIIVLAHSWISFTFGGLLLDPAYTALSLGFIAASVTSYTYQQVERQRGAIREAFGKYLAPAVVEALVTRPDKLQLGGEERELTLMFCDVRNFTSISEQMTPTEVTRFVNELLSPLSEVILSYHGTIDKYMGDAIMAFWNAPLDDAQHAANACQAALEMLARMHDLNAQWKARATNGEEFVPVRIGIGVNTGRCCVGNLGSTFRFDYSAIGDEVNIASRFDGLTKVYGVSNVVGERTLAMAPSLAALEIDLLQVKGRRQPSKIYTLIPPLGIPEDQIQHHILNHKSFLQAYRDQSWDEAEQRLNECRKTGGPALETCYELFRSRIGSFRNTKLPRDWDGCSIQLEKA